MTPAKQAQAATSAVRDLQGPGLAEILLTQADHQALLRSMLLTRAVEEAGNGLYRKGKIPGSFYDGRGQEATSVGAAFALAAGDAICSPLIRDLGAHLVRGTDLTDLFRHYMVEKTRSAGDVKGTYISETDGSGSLEWSPCCPT